MAATAALQTGLPLGLVQVPDVAVQGGHHSKKHTLPMCKECRRHLSSGLKSSSQHGVEKTLGRVSASSGREGAFGQGRLGQSVNSSQSAWSGRRVSLKGGSSGRPSLQIHAQEPDDAEKDVEVKEALLRDALSEKNKKTEEVQQTGFKGKLSATDSFSVGLLQAAFVSRLMQRSFRSRIPLLAHVYVPLRSFIIFSKTVKRALGQTVQSGGKLICQQIGELVKVLA
jgi:uncharacterized membrane protein